VTTEVGRRLPLFRLAALTVAAVVIHGYHLGVDDGEIYVPAARRLLNSKLYPLAPEFFLSHAHLSLFSPTLAWTARLTHLSIDWTVFAWYVATLFGMIFACWRLAAACFESPRARWCAVLVMTAVVSMPATNTGLLLMDPYLSARSFSTPLTIFALACILEAQYVRAAIAVLLTATVHPQMVVYLLFLICVMWVMERSKRKTSPRVATFASFVFFIPGGFQLAPATGPYQEALYSRDFYFIANWHWYHWLGMLAPLAFLAWFWRANLRGTRPGFARLSFALIPFGLLSIVAALIFSSSHAFDMFARTQPLRTFHLITVVFVLLLSGVVGEYAARSSPWVIGAIALPLACGMYFVQEQTYPYSPHVELPSSTSPNAWVNTLLWIRSNTPENAVFAVDSRYFLHDKVDQHGFRAISARSELADYFKDGGVVAIFPFLAPEWKQMSDATYGLNHFTLAQFRTLRQQYPEVGWTVIYGAPPPEMNCPYQRDSYSVCHMPAAIAN
jgi:MFS family permease